MCMQLTWWSDFSRLLRFFKAMIGSLGVIGGAWCVVRVALYYLEICVGVAAKRI